MRVLLIKTSSLGDVVHAFPAVTDACKNNPELKFDWVVEEAFADIPAWHPDVYEVIPVAWRRWRKSLASAQTRSEIKAFKNKLQSKKYDLVLDAQGLVKSAVMSRMAIGPRHGLDRSSAREPVASFFYQHKHNVPRKEHAIQRLRELFANTFAYGLPDSPIDYGINKDRWLTTRDEPYIVFLHGTTWVTKLWPESYWRELCQLAYGDGYKVYLPWGNSEEHDRAKRIAENNSNTSVLDRVPLSGMGQRLANSRAVIGVDSGLTHIAAALNIPTVAIYGATDTELTGVSGSNVSLHVSHYKCAPCLSKSCFSKIESLDYPPCYQELTPEVIWDSTQKLLTTK